MGVTNGYMVFFLGIESILKLLVMMVAQLSEYIKNH